MSMKIFKISKNGLIWTEMPQLDYKWSMPILVDHKRNVLLGNSLRDRLNNEVIIIVIEKNERLAEDLLFIENKLAEENNLKRIGRLEAEIRDYLREVRKPIVENVDLFEFRDTNCITEENFILPPPYDFTKHRKKDINDLQIRLFEFEDEIKQGKPAEDDIEIDLEILKELL